MQQYHDHPNKLGGVTCKAASCPHEPACLCMILRGRCKNGRRQLLASQSAHSESGSKAWYYEAWAESDPGTCLNISCLAVEDASKLRLVTKGFRAIQMELDFFPMPNSAQGIPWFFRIPSKTLKLLRCFPPWMRRRLPHWFLWQVLRLRPFQFDDPGFQTAVSYCPMRSSESLEFQEPFF